MALLRTLVLLCFFTVVSTGFLKNERASKHISIQDKPNMPLNISWDRTSWTGNIVANKNGKINFVLLHGKGSREKRFFPKNCNDLKSKVPKARDGVYTIYPIHPRSPVNVYCEMSIHGGGWTVIQKRFDGSVNFYRNWTEYKNGFGSAKGEYWIGNDNIHYLTSNGSELIVSLQAFSGVWKYARYNNFTVENEATAYRLQSVGNYSGDAGDSLTYHKGMKFSTIDRDNDKSSTNCAALYSSWWHKSCYYSNLNGKYFQSEHTTFKSMNWYHLSKTNKSLKTSIMMIREK